MNTNNILYITYIFFIFTFCLLTFIYFLLYDLFYNSNFINCIFQF